MGGRRVISNESRRAIRRVASVGTKGGIRNRVMQKPLKAPKPRAMLRPSGIATTEGHPACSIDVVETAVAPQTLPTDRSMPPHRDNANEREVSSDVYQVVDRAEAWR